jgi:hypothetical protein
MLSMKNVSSIVFIISLFLLFTSCGRERKSMNIETAQGQALICNQNSGQVCGQPPMPPCAPNTFCAQVMPNPKTYTSDCKMKEARASLISSGQCLQSSL